MTNSVSIEGTMSLCLIADGADFRSRRVASLTLEFAGIVGDIHAGVTRRAGSREPWYPRGTVTVTSGRLPLFRLRNSPRLPQTWTCPPYHRNGSGPIWWSVDSPTSPDYRGERSFSFPMELV
jgi:hypothetical protein